MTNEQKNGSHFSVANHFARSAARWSEFLLFLFFRLIWISHFSRLTVKCCYKMAKVGQNYKSCSCCCLWVAMLMLLTPLVSSGVMKTVPFKKNVKTFDEWTCSKPQARVIHIGKNKNLIGFFFFFVFFLFKLIIIIIIFF